MFATSRLRITHVVLACAVLTTACGQSTSTVSSAESADAAEISEEITPVSDPESTIPDAEQDGSPEDASSDDRTSGKETALSVESTTSTSTTATTSTSTPARATTTSADETTSTSSTTVSPAQPVDTPADDVAYDPGLEPLVDQARADLASRLEIGEEQIALTLAELRAWPNSANGCPIDGLNYLQVVTDGAEIMFVAAGASYRYTTGGQVYAPKLCEN